MRKLLIPAILLASVAAPAAAQDSGAEARVDRLERQVRALQRQVFPGGNPEFFEPEIQPSTGPAAQAGNPAAGPITDVLDRVNALERQLATLTGQVEENSHRLRQLQAAVDALQPQAVPLMPDADADVPASLGGEAATSAPVAEGGDVEAEEEGEAAPEATGTPFRAEGSEAPLPDDPGEASYVRGYRLWRDGRYAEARAQLRQTIEQFPGHRFESYARNLLGRAYLDDNKPANATEIFVSNYQELPTGERAADSLFYLGIALTQLNYNDRACLAFDELVDVYGEGLRSDIAEQLPAARQAANCS